MQIFLINFQYFYNVLKFVQNFKNFKKFKICPEKEDIAAGELEELGCLLRFSPGDELDWGGNCGEELEVDIRKPRKLRKF